jgi:hypothetical protein
MMEDYKNNPRDAAGFFGAVRKNNYLAHTIREISGIIYKMNSKNYHIITRISGNLYDNSKIVYHNRGCIIYLPTDCEELGDRSIRLILAHELGHLVYNIDKIGDLDSMRGRDATKEEELFAWEFAYHLIKRKSDDHRFDIERGRHVYTLEELRRSLFYTVRKNMPEIYDDIRERLAD